MTLVEPLSEEQLNRVYSPILSPLIWDLGHIANFEEQWLIREIAGREPLRGDLGDLYDAIEQPRKVRGELPILTAGEVFPYMEQVRERTLEVLDEMELDPENPLLADGFVYEMLLAHEHQHNETMLQLLQMIESYEPVRTDDGPAAEPVTDGPEMVEVPGGEHEIGAGPAEQGFAYDNERPRHTVELEAFEIDRTPVTNAAYIALPGGEPRRRAADVLGARRRGRTGSAPRWAAASPSTPRCPVIHVSWHEADAFAALGRQAAADRVRVGGGRGGRRPRARQPRPASRSARRPAGAYGDAPSDHGALQMLGDVWEWTSSEFEAYPGFEAFPYPEYSEVFFGEGYKVLRGGAWSARRNVIRPTFRNWDNPERKQIFSGFRCASDS